MSKNVPVYIGEAAYRILKEAEFFSSGVTLNPAGFLRHRESFALGPFTITPFLIYLEQPGQKRLLSFFERHGLPLVTHHAPGHAFVPDLQRLATAIAPGRLVPIHSFAPDRFGEFFDNVEMHRDGSGGRCRQCLTNREAALPHTTPRMLGTLLLASRCACRWVVNRMHALEVGRTESVTEQFLRLHLGRVRRPMVTLWLP